MTLQKQLDHIKECMDDLLKALERCNDPKGEQELEKDYWRLMDERRAILYDISAEAAQKTKR